MVMEQHGVKWLQKGTHEKHLSVLDFEKQERAKEVAELDSQKQEKTSEVAKLNQSVSSMKQELMTTTIKQVRAEEAVEKARDEGIAVQRDNETWHVEVQEELDKLKQEKKDIKRQIQLADGIIKEDLYTAYYAVSGKEEIVADRDVEIPGIEEKTAVEEVAAVVVEPDLNVEVMNSNNNQNEIDRQKEQIDRVRKQQIDLEGIGIQEIYNSSDVNVTRMDENITDVKGKSEIVELKEKEPVDKVDWIVRRIS